MPVEQRLDLRARATDGCGARHDLGSNPFVLPGACRQPVERHLVEGCDGAERTADEMQLVLDDERRGRQRCAAVERRSHSARICGAIEAPLVLAVDMAEEGARLGEPGKAGEFVDCRNDEGRQTAVDHLIDGQNWERPRSGEGAGRIGAADFHVPRRLLRRNAGEAVARKRRRAPRAGFDRRRRLAAVLAIAPHAGDGGVFAAISCLAEPVRRGGGADPEADLDRPVAEERLSPSCHAGSPRISSSAQTTPLARDSWSSVRRRSV